MCERMISKKGFVIILVIGLIAALILLAWVVIDLGCGESLQTKTRNDLVKAYYVAEAGAERMYAKLKNVSNISTNNPTFLMTVFPQTISSTTMQIGSTTIGSYSATASTTSDPNTFVIVSNGTVNGRTTRLTVKYGYTTSYNNGVPVGCGGNIVMVGHGPSWWPASVSATGPIEAKGTISPSSNSNSVYVQYTGDVTQNKTDLSTPSFWLYNKFDTTGNAPAYSDANNDGRVTVDEVPATPAEQAKFAANDVYPPASGSTLAGDGIINDKDAFFYYYAYYLNNNNRTGSSLGINPGGTNYYDPSSGTKDFGPWTVPAGTSIVFVDGNSRILFSGTNWTTGSADLTIVSMGTTTIVEPINGTDDRLTLISYGDIYTGGEGLFGSVKGDLVMYSSGDVNMVFGGNTQGSTFASQNMNVDTELPFGLFARQIKQGSNNFDWSDPSKIPLGIPPGYRQVVKKFEIKGSGGAGGYKPRWQKR